MAKIVDVQAVQPSPETAPPGWRRWCGQVAVRVTSDDGLTGYGVAGGGVASTTLVNHLLNEQLSGHEADDIQGVWDAMYQATLPYGQKGLAIMALSGIDLALWDRSAKAAGARVADVLGIGDIEAVPAYKTETSDPSGDLARGYLGIKVAARDGMGADAAVREVSQLRERLGSDCRIMVDVGMRWDLGTTLAFIASAEQYNLEWLEEPLPADDLEGYQVLVSQSPVPIAGGEHEFTAKAFERIMEIRAHDVVQPDVTWCGGMTEMVKIIELAGQYGVRVCPHRGGEAWALPAIAAMLPGELAEEPRNWLDWVVGQPPMSSDGFHLSDEPGFGVCLDELPWT